MIRSLLVAALLVVGVLAAPAAAQYEPGPTVSLAPTTAVAGATVVLAGQQCLASSPVTIAAPGMEAQTTTAGPDGSWTSSVVVPAGTSGTWSLTVTCGDAVLVASVQVGAVDSSAPQAAPLPVTGSQTVPFAAVGAGLVAGGLLLVLLVQRRADRA